MRTYMEVIAAFTVEKRPRAVVQVTIREVGTRLQRGTLLLAPAEARKLAEAFERCAADVEAAGAAQASAEAVGS